MNLKVIISDNVSHACANIIGFNMKYPFFMCTMHARAYVFPCCAHVRVSAASQSQHLCVIYNKFSAQRQRIMLFLRALAISFCIVCNAVAIIINNSTHTLTHASITLCL